MALKQRLLSNKHITTIAAGIIIGVLYVFIQVSFAALIFSGELSQFLPYGVGLLLAGAVVMGIITVFTSKLSTAIAGPQDSPVAILAVVAAAIVAALPASVSSEQVYFTVVAAIMVATILTAFTFLLLGKFNLGDLIRFIPFPVFSGFLAGTGWLLVVGSYKILTNAGVRATRISTLLDPERMYIWFPGMILALTLLFFVRRTGKSQYIIVILVSGIALFYIGLFISGGSPSTAKDAGWVLGSFPEGSLWRPLTLEKLGSVEWSIIVDQLGNLGAVVLISIIGLLFHASGLELIYSQNVDLNDELQSSGLSNLAAGLVGGVPGFHAISLSSMGYRMTGTRWVGLVSALVSGFVLLFGGSILSYFPKFIVGGLILYIGLDFLMEWLYDTWHKLPKGEYALIVAIVAIVGLFGFLQGVVAGIFLAVILFVINYSRVNTIKHVFSGSSYQSNVDRAVHHRRILNEHGEEVYIVKLQGYIFFGTAFNIFTNINDRASSVKLPKISMVILDFQLVNRLDSSALNSFTKLVQMAEKRGFSILFTHLSSDLESLFFASDFAHHHGRFFKVFPDLDHGMEWCEDKILSRSGATLPNVRRSLSELLEQAFPGEMDYTLLIKFMERKEIPAGGVLLKQDSQNELVFFVESGRITAQIEDKDTGTLRLRSMGPGTIIGELSFYLNSPTSASVIADVDTVVYQLSKMGLQKMESEKPQAASGFHKLITLMLAERLLNSTRSLRALRD